MNSLIKNVTKLWRGNYLVLIVSPLPPHDVLTAGPKIKSRECPTCCPPPHPPIN